MNAPNDTVSRERAAKDAQHIAELLKSTAYNDYFVRRLDARMGRVRESIENDDMDPIKREELRQQLKAYKEIKSWVSQAEIASCEIVIAGPKA